MKFSKVRYLIAFCYILSYQESYSQFLNLDSCLQVLKTSKEDTNKVILLSEIAWDISYKNLQQGIDYSNKAFDLAKKLNYESYYARLCNIQGAIYADMAEQGKALTLFLEGLNYGKKHNQLTIQGALYNSLGNLYAKKNDNAKALYYYLQSVDYIKKSDPNKLPDVAYSNIAGIYTGYKKLDSAMYYLNLCLDYNLKTNNKNRLINNYISLSEIYYELNEKEKCLKTAQDAVNIAIEINDVYTLSHAYIQLGDALYLNQSMSEAIIALNKATVYAKKNGDISALETICQYLSLFYEEEKR